MKHPVRLLKQVAHKNAVRAAFERRGWRFMAKNLPIDKMVIGMPRQTIIDVLESLR